LGGEKKEGGTDWEMDVEAIKVGTQATLKTNETTHIKGGEGRPSIFKTRKKEGEERSRREGGRERRQACCSERVSLCCLTHGGVCYSSPIGSLWLKVVQSLQRHISM